MEFFKKAMDRYFKRPQHTSDTVVLTVDYGNHPGSDG